MTTETQGAAAATPQRRRIVGYNPSLATFAAVVLLGAFVLTWVELGAPHNDGSDLLNVLPAVCLLVTVFCLLGTCRVVVDPAGFIEVFDLFTVHRVPVNELVAIEHDEGLHLRVVSGRRIGSYAYGASLIGFLLRYPRSVRAARRIEDAVGGLPGHERTPQWRSDTVSSALRVRAYLGTLAVNAVLVLGTVLLNLAQTAAQQ